MKLAAFEAAAARAYEAVPEEYKAGIDGLVVSRESVPHPDLPDVFTLGECLTDSWPAEVHGPETTRSVVVLYWGSFQALARRDESFDWDAEIWETLTHELRHHLESLASEDQLEAVDYAVDEDFKRAEGQPFDPWYFQRAEPAGPGAYRIERHTFLEQVWTGVAFDSDDRIDFDWDGRAWSIPRPHRLGDVHFVLIEGVTTPPDTLELVLVRRRSWIEHLRRLFIGAAPLETLESEARATARH